MKDESNTPETPEAGFVKDAVVRPVHTPSVVSGQPSSMVKHGEAYAKNEPEVERIEDLKEEF